MDPHPAPFGMLPIGLAMALAQDPAAMRAFAQLSPARQDRVISAARRARSKEEMRRLVSALSAS